MAFPLQKLGPHLWRAADASQRDAMGSRERIVAGVDRVILDSDGAIYALDTVDGVDASSWSRLSAGTLSRIPLDADVQALYDFTWDPETQTPDGTDRSPNGYDLPAHTGTVYFGMVGSLPCALFDDASYTAAGPQANLEITGDLTIELLTDWAGSGSTSAPIVQYDITGESLETNALYQIANGATGRGLRMFWESGEGTPNHVQDFPMAEPSQHGAKLITYVRDDAAKEHHFYMSGNLVTTETYTTSAEGGTSSRLSLFTGNLTAISVAGLCISDVARSASNVLARARAVGLA